jgi:hypothetical protein
MSDDPYKAPEVGSEVPKTTDPQPPFIDSKVLWIVFGLFGGITILATFLSGGSGSVMSRRFAIGLCEVLLSVVALRQRWGPMLPCMVLGVICAEFFSLVTSVGADQPVVFATGILAGGLLGYFGDSRRKLNN